MNSPSFRAGLPVFIAILALWSCIAPSTVRAASLSNDATQESFRQFDQNLNGGWRPMQLQRDYRGAADAILQFMSEHDAELRTWQKASLAFHLGHVYALMDDRANAIHWFNQSLSYHALDNPAYVQGFIAFLQNDKPALIADRRAIASMQPGLTREEDLKELDAMIEYFGAPFEAAWGALNCVATGAKADPKWSDFCRAVSAKYHSIYLQRFAARHSR